VVRSEISTGFLWLVVFVGPEISFDVIVNSSLNFIRVDLNYEFGEVLMTHEDTYLLSIGHILQWLLQAPLYMLKNSVRDWNCW